MRRILFVGDHAEVLNAHRERLKNHTEVEALFPLGSDAALKLIQNTPIDVIVADMHMREVDGLLRTIKEENPDIVRLMLCPQHETQSTFFALSTVHQILSKPLDADRLVNAVERSCRLRELLTDSLRKKIGGVVHLPGAPAVYLELTNALDRPDVSNLKIARIIEKDAPTAAKILQLVNSACFGTLKHVASLENAVAYLGMELIRGLSLTIYVFSAFEAKASRAGLSFEAEQGHSLMTARLAKRLVSGRRQSQDAFTAGLLHDIGKLVLAVCIPESFMKAQLVCKATGRPPHEVEAEMIGVTHAEAGAYLLGLWGLPYPIVEAVAYHHNPSAALERTLDIPTAVSAANALVEEITENRPIAIAEHLQSLGLIDELPVWAGIAQQEFEQVTPENAVVQ
jgi:putative nucleotidyltransferase with HDIG domain